ncbi:hypothetical protein RKD55_000706 [Rossellomorea marisflavi]
MITFITPESREANLPPSTKCSAAKGGRTPTGIARKMRPWRRSRSGSSLAPRKAGRPQRNETVPSFHPTQYPLDGVEDSPIKNSYSLRTRSPLHQRVQCSGGRPDSYGNSEEDETLEAQPKRLIPRPEESRTTAAKRNGPLSSPHPLPTGWGLKIDLSQTPTGRELNLPHIKECSAAEGDRIQREIAGRVRPRKHEEAHRTPRGKRAPAAKRNGPLSSLHPITKGWNQFSISSPPKQKNPPPASHQQGIFLILQGTQHRTPTHRQSQTQDSPSTSPTRDSWPPR